VEVQELLADRVGDDVFFYSISLDPGNDTPEVLKRYADGFGVKPGWLFLTGDSDEITALRRKFGLYDPDPLIDADKSQHAGLLVYGNERIGRWGAMPSLDKPRYIVRALGKVMPQRGENDR
jgi:protein SCO1/2